MPVQSCRKDNRPGFKFGTQGKCYTYMPGNMMARNRAKQLAHIQGAAIGEENTNISEQNVSDAPWASVDKSKLPRSAFLVKGDPDRKSTWKLPYKDLQGRVNLGALRAIAGAIAGARTGTPMSISSDVRKKINNLLKKHKIGKFAEESTIREAAEQFINDVKS